MVQYDTQTTMREIMTIALIFLFIVKLISTIFVEGFLAMFCLWPINDKPTSKGQFIFFGVLSFIFIGWLFNWYQFICKIN